MNRTLLWTPVMQDNLLQGLSVKHTQTTSGAENIFRQGFFHTHWCSSSVSLIIFFFDPTGNEGTPFIPLRIPDYYLYTPHPQRKNMNSREVHCLTVRTMSLRSCEGQFWIWIFFFQSVQPQIAFSTSRSVPLSLWHVSPLNINLQ